MMAQHGTIAQPRTVVEFEHKTRPYRIIDVGSTINLYELQQDRGDGNWIDTNLAYFSPDALIQLLAAVIDEKCQQS